MVLQSMLFISYPHLLASLPDPRSLPLSELIPVMSFTEAASLPQETQLALREALSMEMSRTRITHIGELARRLPETSRWQTDL